jgi:hypothetical protein
MGRSGALGFPRGGQDGWADLMSTLVAEGRTGLGPLPVAMTLAV